MGRYGLFINWYDIEYHKKTLTTPLAIESMNQCRKPLTSIHQGQPEPKHISDGMYDRELKCVLAKLEKVVEEEKLTPRSLINTREAEALTKCEAVIGVTKDCM